MWATRFLLASRFTNGGIEGFADFVLALGVAGQNTGGAKLFGVFGGRGERDRRRGKDAMSTRGAASGDAAKLKRNDFIIQQCDQPTHGAHEALGLARTPVHIFGPVKSGDFLGDKFGEKVKRRLALAKHVGGKILTLGRGGCGEFGERDSYFFGEGNGGLGGLAVLVSVGGGWAEKLLGTSGCDAARP